MARRMRIWELYFAYLKVARIDFEIFAQLK